MPRKKIDGPPADTRILCAARKLFFKNGYDPVSTDMIAKEARVSKATLYNTFGGKKETLIATILKESEKFVDPKFKLPTTLSKYRPVLIEFGTNLLSQLSEDDIQRFDQVMLSQAILSPEISTDFYLNAYQKSFDHVEELIDFGQKQGYLESKESTKLLTEMLLHSWIGKPYHMAMYGFENTMINRKRKRVTDVLRIVLSL